MELTVREMDLDELVVTEYAEDGTATQMSWGEYKSKHKVQQGDQRWINKVSIEFDEGLRRHLKSFDNILRT